MVTQVVQISKYFLVEMVAHAGDLSEALTETTDAIKMAESQRGWNASAKDLYSRAIASFSKANGAMPSAKALFSIDSNKPQLTRSSLMRLGVDRDPTGFKLGLGTWSMNELQVIVVLPKSFGADLGYQNGDLIESVDGVKPADLVSLREVIKNGLGSKINIVVMRKGKLQELDVAIPKEIESVGP